MSAPLAGKFQDHYAILGVEYADGKIAARDDLFEPKGDLVVQSLRVGETTWTRDGRKS